MDTETTNPQGAEVELVPDAEELDFEDQDNPEADPEPEEPELVEVERDGKTYRIPADLKDDFLRQGDYTRKTQELAAERKELASLKERVQQAGESEVAARAQVIAIEAAMQQYQNVDWDALEAQDPVAAQRHFRQFMQLQSGLGEAQNAYQSAVQQRTFETQQEAAKRIEQGLAELQRDIPNWGPDLANQLLDFGEKAGFSRDFMNSVDDPKLVKLMHMAFLAAKATPKPAATQAQNIKPASKVKGSSSNPAVGLDDRLGPDEWLKRRNEQLRRK